MDLHIISSKTLQELMKKEDLLLIDLRDRDAFERGHIPHAVWMNWEQAEEVYPRLLASQKSKPGAVVFYCDRGNISLLTARDLASLGYSVMSLNHGFSQWTGDVALSAPEKSAT